MKLPPRAYGTNEEQRLSETLERLCAQMLSSLDSAIRLRDAPDDAKRHRAKMKRNLEDAMCAGMDAAAYAMNKESTDG